MKIVEVEEQINCQNIYLNKKIIQILCKIPKIFLSQLLSCN